jgi:hypothetical protein
MDIKSHLGPQQIGGIYENGYWGYGYEVVNIEGFKITCKLINNDKVNENLRNQPAFQVGRVWSHMTSWDRLHDTVISQPYGVGTDTLAIADKVIQYLWESHKISFRGHCNTRGIRVAIANIISERNKQS